MDHIEASIREIEDEITALKAEIAAIDRATDNSFYGFLLSCIRTRERAIGERRRLQEHLRNPPVYHQTVVGVLLEGTEGTS